MDGARLILNARYFHIAQTGEKATKYAFVAEAAAGLVNYIATRESVIYNYDEHYKEVSATEAQREAINQFLEVSPDLELSREFKAYDEDRSAANASALISRVAISGFIRKRIQVAGGKHHQNRKAYRRKASHTRFI